MDERTTMSPALGDWLDAVARPSDARLVEVYAEHANHPRAMMMTSPEVGRLLAMLVQATGGTRVVEVGTFVGVTATWMAGSLAPGGLLETLHDELHAQRHVVASFDERPVPDLRRRRRRCGARRQPRVRLRNHSDAERRRALAFEHRAVGDERRELQRVRSGG